MWQGGPEEGDDAMRIGQSFGPGGVTARPGVTGKADAQGFAERVAGRPSAKAAAAAAGLAPLASLGAVLAIQAVDDPLAGRRRARERGERLLDTLEEVRIALLDGRLPADKLEALRQLVTARRDGADDPALRAVLDEIELRAAVELAKLESRDAAG
jgi:hypothetical protein